MANYNSDYTGVQIDSAISRANSTDVTAGTVTASKAVVVDSNKDITGFRHITATGTVTAANVSLTGNVDLGDASGDTVTITGSIDSNLIPATDDTYDLGSASNAWQDLFLEGDINFSDGAQIDVASGDFTLDVAGDIEFNADGGDFNFKDDSSTYATITSSGITTANTVSFGSITDGAITVTAFESSLTSGAALVPTSAAVKTYVDAQVTAQDLDFQGDSGGALNIDLDSESFTFTGGTGVVTVGSGNTMTFNSVDSEIVHDNLSGFVANEHIDHTSVTLTAGNGLSGGGTIAANRTFALDLNELSAKTSIVDADLIAMVDSADSDASKKITFENLEDAVFASVSGDITITEGGVAQIADNSVDLTTHSTGNYVATITGGTGIDSSAATSGEGTTHSLSIDLNELTTETSIADDDFIAMVDATDDASGKITFENLEDAIFASVSGDIAIAEDGAATIQANSVALGTDTTGNYVATIADSGGGGITVANSGAESAAVTLELDIKGLTDDAIASGDFIAFSDEGESGDPANRGQIDDVATLFAGTGLTASSAVIGVDASQTQITSVGTLGAGAISSGFGAIDNGSSTANFGATTVDSLSVSDGNVTNVGDIALDSISPDGTTINVAVTDNTSDTFTIKQGSDKYFAIDTTNSGEDIAIGTGISGTAISIGHSTSVTTVNDNLIVTGDLTINGDTTTISTTNTVVADTLMELGNGTSGTPGNDSGIVIERGSAANAFIGFDESDDKFIVGTGTFTGASTGSLTITTGTLKANIEGNVTGNVTGNTSGTALTVTQAAQTAITSVGTLTALQVDNININGNTIISSDTNGHINLTPNGSGEVNISKVDIDSGTIDGATIATSDVTVGSGKTLDVSGGTLTLADDQIPMAKTAIVAGTGISLSTNTLNVDASQTQITSVGTIGTGVWQGTAIASAYLDADTAHLSGSAFTGNITMADDTSIGIADDAERIEFDGAGDISVLGANFGIGVSAPAEMLEIYHASSPAIQLNDGGDYQGIIRLAGNDLEIRGSSGTMEFYNGSADGDSSTLAMSIDSSQNATFAGDVNVTADGARFFVNSATKELVSIGRAGSSGDALQQGYFRMKNNTDNKIALHTAGDSYFNGGNVGIGTASPDNLLQLEFADGSNVTAGNIADESATGLVLTNTTNSNGNGTMIKMESNNGSNATAIGHIQDDATSAHMAFYTELSGTFSEKMRLQHDGVLVLKASTPTIQLQDTDDDAVRGIISQNSTVMDLDSDSDITFSPNNTEKMRITSGGNVGIGTTSPAHKLQVSSGGADGGIGLLATGGYNNVISFGDADDSDIGKLIYDHGANAMTFTTNTTERMRITSGGNFFFGTESSSVNSNEFQYAVAGSSSAHVLRTGFINRTQGTSTSRGNILTIGMLPSGTIGSSNCVAQGTTIGAISFLSNANSDSYGSASIENVLVTGSVNQNRTDHVADLLFRTKGSGSAGTTERMRITGAGHLHPSANNAYNLGSASLRWSVLFTSNSVNVSDKTMKQDIADCDLGIDFVNTLKPKSFKMKDLEEKHDDYNKKHYGLIAQDLKDGKLKDSVYGDKDGEYGLAYNDLIAPLIKAVQELSAKVEALENA